jgi:anti-sigma factor RsiW
MKHDKIRRNLSLYLDDQIAPKQKPLIERHLRECESCSRYLRQLNFVRQIFSSIEPPKVKPFFAQRVLAAYNAKSRDRFWAFFDWMPRRLVFAGFTASVVILCLFMVASVPTALQSDSAFAQLYAEQSYSLLETDDQALAFAIQNDYQNSTGE